MEKTTKSDFGHLYVQVVTIFNTRQAASIGQKRTEVA